MNIGFAYALPAFGIRGIFRLYVQRIADVAAVKVVVQRPVGSLAFVLREWLVPVSWMTGGPVVCGVLRPIWHAGRLPWIALALAGSFGRCGLIRKSTLDAVQVCRMSPA
jgi:EamA domain-containing membrane protein RarD